MIRIFHSNLEQIVEDYTSEIEKKFASKRNNINIIVGFLSSPQPIREWEVKGKIKPLLKALKVVLGKKKLEKVKNISSKETDILLYHLNNKRVLSESGSKARNICKLKQLSEQLETIFHKNELRHLISGKVRELKRLNNDFSVMCTLDNALYDYFFDYQDYYDILNDYIVNRIKIICCPYCNRNYITSVTNVKGKRIIGPTYDHFFHKNKYKFLTLSFYNLIPSCYVCNSNLKGQTDFDLDSNLYPYEDEFGDQATFDFKMNLVKIGKNVEISFEPEIKIAPFASQEIKKKLIGYSAGSGEAKPGSLKVFQLEEIYKSHYDTVEEIHTKFDVNSPYYIESIKEILDLLEVSEEEFYRYHFHNYYANHDFHRRPLAKLTRDIYNKMKLLQ